MEPVPKIAFSFWEGTQFTYMHYLTMLSFSKFNPDFRIIIYTTNKSENKVLNWSSHEQKLQYTNFYDFNKLKDIPNLEIQPLDINAEIGYDQEISSVWKSDIIRVKKLMEHGGFYIDFDTLFIKKIDEALIHLPNDIGLNYYHGVFNNAFIVSRPNGIVITKIYEEMIRRLRSNFLNNNYMFFGSTLITPLIMNNIILKRIVFFIPNEMTCPYLFNEMDKLFYTNINKITDNTFCIHWYNGDVLSRKYCSNFIYGKEINENKCIFEKLLMCVLA